MKQYLLFAGKERERLGGWYDFVDCFKDEMSAVNAGRNGSYLWFHVVDLLDGQIVAQG